MSSRRLYVYGVAGWLCFTGNDEVAPSLEGDESLRNLLADVVDRLHSLQHMVQSDFGDHARYAKVSHVALRSAAGIVRRERKRSANSP